MGVTRTDVSGRAGGEAGRCRNPVRGSVGRRRHVAAFTFSPSVASSRSWDPQGNPPISPLFYYICHVSVQETSDRQINRLALQS